MIINIITKTQGSVSTEPCILYLLPIPDMKERFPSAPVKIPPFIHLYCRRNAIIGGESAHRRPAHEKQATGYGSQIACNSKLWGIPQVLTIVQLCENFNKVL